jgi:hypothetical protein
MYRFYLFYGFVIAEEIRLDGVNWSHPAQDRDQWQDLVNMQCSVQFHGKQEIL